MAVELDDDIFEATNEFGFPQMFQHSGTSTKPFPICISCHCYVMPNRGQGMVCGDCAHRAEVEMAHDYDTFCL